MKDDQDKATADIFKPDNLHGGKRRGAGRKSKPPKNKRQTKVMRVPVEHVAAVKDFIREIEG
jgi:sporulation protein YlmC with PRC-barrel domain